MKKYNKKRNSNDRITKNRVAVLFILCLLLGFVFFIRLFQLQIAGGDVYRKEAQIQKTKTINIPASRGAIYDRNHNILAQNVKMNTVYVTPQSIKEEDKTKIAESLGSIINLDSSAIIEKMEDTKPVKLATGLTIDQVQAIYKLIEENNYKSISINSETNRFYPNGRMGSYLLGFTDLENKGVYGVENTFDKDLRGTPGKNILYGRAVPKDQGNLFEPTAGKELSLTIDYKIQSIINKYGEETMKKYNPKKMSVIVMKPKTGEVLGMENFPKYDPNNPRVGRTEEEKKLIEEMDPEERTNYYYDIWRSFSINDTYEPGSVFKAITAAVALEEKTTKEDSKYVCEGFITDIPGVKIRCHRWYDPHGEQTLSEALNNSCNPAFVQIIREIGKEKFFKYLSGFGFGEKTGIKLPGEEKGLIPKNVDSIGEAELATLSYGHGLSATPIQMITAMNAVVNGGYIIQPKLVLSEEEKNEEEVKIEDNKNIVVKRQVISEETSAKMNELLYSVINEGTGSTVSIPGYKIGGKSGTSIKLEDGQYKDNKTDASFFISYPVDNPKYTILVVVDEPQGDNGGNTVAGPVAKNILEDIIRENKYPADYNQDEEIAAQNISVPDVTGMTLKNATRTLRDQGLQSLIYNSSTDINMIIQQQSPQAYTKVSAGTAVELVADPSGLALIKIPDLVNDNMDYGIAQLKELGIEYQLSGDTEGKIIKTEPEAGTLIEPGSKIKIIIKNDESEETNNETLENSIENDQNAETGGGRNENTTSAE